ncbi:MAG: Spy/CpxP family protein refolding chaperone [Halioglobus sp.]
MSVKKNYLFVFGALGFLLSVCASTTSAHPMDRITDRLELSEEQQQSLLSLRADSELGRDAARESHQEVSALLKSGDTDGAADLAGEQARDRIYKRAQRHQQLAEILTPEQLAQWKELRPQRPERASREGRYSRNLNH